VTGQKTKMFLIRFPYFLGIAADALWAIALFFPSVLGILLNNPEFNPEIQVKLIMGIAGTLMTGWTILLIWAVQRSIKRRAVILITVFPVVFGLLIITLIGYLGGNTSNIWILIKTTILFITMMTSYILSGKTGYTLLFKDF
jgi:hypothetical protein